jgi:cysteine-rich repeat protein
MQGRRLAATLLVAAALAGSGAALAVRPPGPTGPATAPRRAAPPLEASPASGLRLRDHAAIGWRDAPAAAAAAWARFRAETGDNWIASWDEATQVPSRLLGRGVPAPHAVADGGAAERFARGFLARHIDLLAPGADPADFVLVSNVLHRGMRVVGFRQTAGGMQVLGGQVSFRFKNDRLFVIGSEALPHVTLPRAAARVGAPPAAADVARSGARGWVLSDAAGEASAGEVSGPFVLPLVGDAGVLGYRVVHRVDVAANAPIGRFWVYTDAASGAPIAREQRLRFADGVVQFNVPVRYPAAGRQPYPARRGIFLVDGSLASSDEEGRVTWAGNGPVEVVARTTGPLVVVQNQDDGKQPAEHTFSLDPGGTLVWDESGDELLDAQLTGFIHARLVKDYARTIAPDLTWLDQALPVNVNIQDQCNAFSDGQSINFFQSSPQCANTGTLPDVIYHEFGHTLHAHSIIDGVGTFDGAHSEGLSDYLAATITGDHGMGRGFFRSDDALRDVDPPDYENSWPRDVGEIHFTGLIFAGAMWDLRKLLVDQFGEEEGVALANHLYYGTLERATNIPSTYAEVLAEDDDDGDLSNGTPHDCDINAAFGAHGLRALRAEVAPLSAEPVGAEGFPVSLRVNGFSAACPGDGVASAHLTWRLRDQDADTAQTIEMTEVEDGGWTATIPPVDAGQVVRYRIAVDLLDGAALSFPDNLGDPEYEFYAGPVEELYCTDFETDPFSEGWSHGVITGVQGDASDDWTWGEPLAPPAVGDPPAAFSGANVIGTDLGADDTDGFYLPSVHTFVQTPEIDVGDFSDVRLHFWRWLTVEDGFFDRASILANGRLAWTNFNSDQGNQSATHSLDREWRFQDVPVSDFVAAGKVQVRFEIESDGGLQFGGWNVDDFCVVATPGVVCGDGQVTGGETCDDGPANSDSEPDACRTSCRAATCGDGVLDSSEVCDDGNLEDGDACSADCAHGDDRAGDCGCDATPRTPVPGGGPILITMLAAMLFGPRAARRLRQLRRTRTRG